MVDARSTSGARALARLPPSNESIKAAITRSSGLYSREKTRRLHHDRSRTSHQMWAAQFFKVPGAEPWMTSAGSARWAMASGSIGVQLAHPKSLVIDMRRSPRCR